MSGRFPAPLNHPVLNVVAIAPFFAPEEGLPYIGDIPLGVRLPRGMPDDGRIDREATVAGVLVEGTLEEVVS